MLGTTGIQVSELALGTGRLGTRSGAWDRAAARDTAAAFVNAGGTLFDTSSRYLGGEGETLVGEVMVGRREEFVVVSKYGRTPLGKPAIAAAGQHRKALRAEVEGSLRRLGTDYIDVLLAHTDDGVTPVEDLMHAFDSLVRSGKVLHVGFSSFPAWRAAGAAAVAEHRGWARPAVLEMHYNLLERAPEREHLPLARARGMAMLAASPLSGGLLSGDLPISYEITEEMNAQHRVMLVGGPQSPEGMVIHDRQAQAVVETVAAIAAEIGTSTVTVAVAWVRATGAIPVLGARDTGELAANLAGAELDLSDEHLARLGEVSLRPKGFPYDMLVHDAVELGLDVTDPQVGATL
ncbi:aldo/keto reductase [Streptomyces sp. S465]|uniref:aldo/keto reductase n=1 Tax=Streptomyces sp. S465 TaxID=2979468 RepID=UPI0022A86A74|nr:aldo/keto reductase [Streptomyces sp. S465]WAP58171.1 aldo/keto reductase [Streptomyces sp. S465]